MRAIRAALMGLAMAVGAAQAAGDDAKPVPDPKKAAAPAERKKAPAKDAAKAPAKDAAKAPARKPAAAPKKPAADAKKAASEPGKGGAATGNPNVRVYKANDPNAPKVRDKDGNVIPTSPDAYDISSALKK